MSVHDIRAFNRFYTNVIGALDYSRHLYAPYTLTESRVLYELAHSPRTDAADLRTELSLDAGYLSRILNKFEQDGLIERTASQQDPRRRRVTLTARGRETGKLLEERASESVGSLLSTVPAAERPRLAEAMTTVRTILSEGRPPRREDVLLREPGPGDLGWIVQRNAALYAAEYGWNADYEGLVARIVADFAEDHDPHLERVWIAELDGRPVGCVMCVRDEAPATARLRLLLVEPDARGLGIGDRLVTAVVDFARGVGYRDLVLWTNDVLSSARRIYQRHGFVLATEKPHRSFGKDLTGQDWRLDLHGTTE
ncbi:bifunctional helix-turn-helix transcriptional regulator/GNAT family N-acetyltransferase [Streptomyces chartreusis]|jgi:DNA-binding MarR family transcriptional regulator/N-acetylglutamate synthase-like GNAT family acetyltransferase|uniref:bifunctional helix-turn-helix transcriptional regulator/GNAT family N-acetyltransferase n=1 Tax=Streptomyces TaxID=1883 RepID=UPI0022B5B13D|nr:bifunctional helix-turn-helix transcriptional regulator/GNAT family N-acetyltransferase [Streptomyces chartreusis]MCZ4610242.1 bifunctional helix-turn-helix transcriptional regulator/GNAT family N-acetyltransferase [Streptomyces sp. Lzd4kr]WSZ69455.1 bifunctional helix-turn-helix transcriptional regulator/GNAT family N-acetyltransferase [Streptomyces chartreusis]WTA27534.1 bifunctional helix-turn-helix transcriptional regulator/GNAT family N-acetyltransferase [Streptomyces chartreusis]WUB181